MQRARTNSVRASGADLSKSLIQKDSMAGTPNALRPRL